MIMSLYDKTYREDLGFIEDAQIIDEAAGQPKKKKQVEYVSDVVNRVRKFKDKNYFVTMFEGSKYPIRGAFLGGMTGACLAMYKKRSIWGGILIGSVLGCVLGYGYSEVRRMSNTEIARKTWDKEQ